MAAGGYAWWYADALSDDGRHGLTIIAFIGSVFSPYYASARRRAPTTADPFEHCALNVALYGAERRWAMTERGSAGVRPEARTLRIGPSKVAWDGDALTVQIDERSTPWASRIRGSVRVVPAAVTRRSYALDADGRHRWWPIAPRARLEVSLQQPALSWSGDGYLDCNRGERPLEDDFACWDWSRAALADGDRAVFYDVTPRRGPPTSLALRFDADGTAGALAAPPRAALPCTGWRIARATRCDPPHAPRIVRTLEDTPFYARSIVQTPQHGEAPLTWLHESLSLDRFRTRWVQALLPFRMPRRRR